MENQINMWALMGEEMPDDTFMTLVGGKWKLDSTTANTSDAPTNPIKRKLSDILERDVDPKYRLSEKACRGILRRAGERGKELPPILKHALMSTAGVGDIEPTTFSKKAHPRNKDEAQGWEESDTAHTLNLFNMGEMRTDELVVDNERNN